MTEIDVDMALASISQAVADLVAAAQDKAMRAYLAANGDRLAADLDRLSDSLAIARETGGAGARRSAPVGRARKVAAAPAMRRPAASVWTGARSHVG